MAKEKVEKTSQLVNLPPELLLLILGYVFGTSDVKAWGKNVQTVGTLSQTCKAFHGIFKSDVERHAKQLLTYVVEANLIKTVELATLNPELLFIKVTDKVREYASGLVEETNENGRVVLKAVPQEYCNIMPVRAAMVVRDGKMLEKLLPIIEKYSDKVTGESGLELTRKQWQAQFPNGVDHPPTNPFDFSELVNAITADQNLRNNRVASPATQKALKNFRHHFKPRLITEEDSHHHFTMRELLKPLNLYDDNWTPWSGNQLEYFWCGAIGGSQRLLSTIEAMWLCQKNLSKVLEEKQECSRELEIENWITGGAESFYPADSNLDCRLGVNFGVVNYAGVAVEGCGLPHALSLPTGVAGFIGKMCRANTSDLDSFKQHLEQPATRHEQRQGRTARQCVIL